MNFIHNRYLHIFALLLLTGAFYMAVNKVSDKVAEKLGLD